MRNLAQKDARSWYCNRCRRKPTHPVLNPCVKKLNLQVHQQLVSQCCNCSSTFQFIMASVGRTALKNHVFDPVTIKQLQTFSFLPSASHAFNLTPAYIAGFHFEWWDPDLYNLWNKISTDWINQITIIGPSVLWLHHCAAQRHMLTQGKIISNHSVTIIVPWSICKVASQNFPCDAATYWKCLGTAAGLQCTATKQNNYKHVCECNRASHHTAMTLNKSDATAMESLLRFACVEPQMWVAALFLWQSYLPVPQIRLSRKLELWTPCTHRVVWLSVVHKWARMPPQQGNHQNLISNDAY